MIYACDPLAAAATRFSRQTAEGALIWRTEFFGPPPSPAASASVDPKAAGFVPYVPPGPGETREPQAFLVEQEPGAIVHPHFHHVDQFQVVVAGSGSIGKHPVAPVSAHFAAAHTGYGPIQTGPDGLQYFSLRASADGTGAQYLPAARARMRAVPRRNLFAPTIAPTRDDDCAAGIVRTETLMDEPDGLSIRYHRAGPSADLVLDGLDAGAGQSIIVTRGAVRHGDAWLGRLSVLFVRPDRSRVSLRSGPDGADLLFLRYPRA
ncbi:hypothetical protein STAQ_26150 [Allostella sp. ATCC 35155]|nr:hypothetical protein STAQ_26150 [Stella sp. ATCC 35155]